MSLITVTHLVRTIFRSSEPLHNKNFTSFLLKTADNERSTPYFSNTIKVNRIDSNYRSIKVNRIDSNYRLTQNQIKSFLLKFINKIVNSTKLNMYGTQIFSSKLFSYLHDRGHSDQIKPSKIFKQTNFYEEDILLIKCSSFITN